jgi:hypothetical protein
VSSRGYKIAQPVGACVSCEPRLVHAGQVGGRAVRARVRRVRDSPSVCLCPLLPIRKSKFVITLRFRCRCYARLALALSWPCSPLPLKNKAWPWAGGQNTSQKHLPNSAARSHALSDFVHFCCLSSITGTILRERRLCGALLFGEPIQRYDHTTVAVLVEFLLSRYALTHTPKVSHALRDAARAGCIYLPL